MRNSKWLTRLATVSATLAISTFSFQANAEWTPPGPIKLMIGFKAGGGVDTQARLIAEELEARHGWKIIPEQVTGKGGINLARELKEAKNDGTAIGMLVSETLSYNLVVARRSGLSLKDFTPLTTTASFQMGIVAKTDKGWGSMEDVISAAKQGNPVRFGAMTPKLADMAYLLGKANNIDFNIVSTKGGKGTMNGLQAGDLDVGWLSGVQNKAVKAGDMVNLASGIKKPLKISPDAPLLKDLGIPFTADGYFMFVAPAGLSDEARQTLSNAIAEIVADPSTKAGKMIQKAFMGADVVKGQALDTFLAEDTRAAHQLLKAASE